MAGEGFVHDMISRLKSNNSLTQKRKSFKDQKSDWEKELHRSDNLILDVESHAQIREKLRLRSQRESMRNLIIFLTITFFVVLLTYLFLSFLL